ncbi:MAG: FHA domain-containing protein [Gemmataceae bacterium]|nr:FHA domain-containing protein [Gemmataceae bacterium]
MRFRLVPLEGGKTVDLTRDLTLVGRKDDCDLRIDHKSISKFHCIIAKLEKELLVRDLGSTNGTKVNGQRIRRAILNSNDCLAIANIPFKVQITNESPPAAFNHDVTLMSQEEEEVVVAEEVVEEKMGEKKGSDSDESRVIPKPMDKINDLPDVYPSNP